MVASAAACALGRIGGKDAIAALIAARNKVAARGPAGRAGKPAPCAELLLAAGDAKGAPRSLPRFVRAEVPGPHPRGGLARPGDGGRRPARQAGDQSAGRRGSPAAGRRAQGGARTERRGEWSTLACANGPRCRRRASWPCWMPGSRSAGMCCPPSAPPPKALTRRSASPPGSRWATWAMPRPFQRWPRPPRTAREPSGTPRATRSRVCAGPACAKPCSKTLPSADPGEKAELLRALGDRGDTGAAERARAERSRRARAGAPGRAGVAEKDCRARHRHAAARRLPAKSKSDAECEAGAQGALCCLPGQPGQGPGHPQRRGGHGAHGRQRSAAGCCRC